MTKDTVDIYTGQAAPEDPWGICPRRRSPRAPRGFLNDEPGLRPPEWIQRWQVRLPALDAREVADVNHYTILMSDRGAAAVSGAVLESCARCGNQFQIRARHTRSAARSAMEAPPAADAEPPT